MEKQTIAVDIDDVLADSAAGFADFSNARWGNKHRAEDYTEAWADFWGVSLEEALKRSKEYHESGAVADYGHHEAAVPVLRHLAERYELIVITSRQRVLQPATDAWLDKYFTGIFSGIHYAGIWDQVDRDIEQRLKHTKAELARELGAQYLIDDQLKHCIGAAAAGLQALLFGDYKHTRDVALPPGVIRVQDWPAVMEYFDGQG